MTPLVQDVSKTPPREDEWPPDWLLAGLTVVAAVCVAGALIVALAWLNYVCIESIKVQPFTKWVGVALFTVGFDALGVIVLLCAPGWVRSWVREHD